MDLRDINRAVLRIAYRALEEDPEFSHGFGVLGRHLARERLDEIKSRRDHYRAFKKDLKTRAALLSPGARSWWAQVEGLIEQGRRADAAGRSSPAAKRINRMSERLEETFEECVPDNERGLFLQSVNDGETWDDRWASFEFRPPLLLAEFAGRAAWDGDPMNAAQRDVIGGLIEDPPTAEELERFDRNRQRLWELARTLDGERSVALDRARKKAEGEATAIGRARKKAKAEAVKKRKAELVARGDQKATKSRRAPSKVVDDLFQGNVGKRPRKPT